MSKTSWNSFEPRKNVNPLDGRFDTIKWCKMDDAWKLWELHDFDRPLHGLPERPICCAKAIDSNQSLAYIQNLSFYICNALFGNNSIIPSFLLSFQ